MVHWSFRGDGAVFSWLANIGWLHRRRLLGWRYYSFHLHMLVGGLPLNCTREILSWDNWLLVEGPSPMYNHLIKSSQPQTKAPTFQWKFYWSFLQGLFYWLLLQNMWNTGGEIFYSVDSKLLLSLNLGVWRTGEKQNTPFKSDNWSFDTLRFPSKFTKYSWQIKFIFRYIQLAINVPTLSTLLYIWLDIHPIFELFWGILVEAFCEFSSTMNCIRCRIIPESLRWLLSKGKVYRWR